MDAHSALVWRTVRALLADPCAAEDASQEAWLDVWRGLPSFRRGRPFRPWLLAVVANRCRMVARRRQPLGVALDDELAGGPAGGVDAPPGPRAEGDPLLAAALARLPTDQRRVLGLRYFADLELGEIAAATGWPLGTVKSRLHRALGALRAELNGGALAQHAKEGQA